MGGLHLKSTAINRCVTIMLSQCPSDLAQHAFTYCTSDSGADSS